ncbi:hypothetical protein DIPPA_31991 [Diplonema papillatum]|nr:hypothetical protein DIPPA_31991 [Diplonema papillatum]|eukprot:gene19115-29439_t
MLGARYRKAFEAREKKQKEARVRRFVTKRRRMHWGMYTLEGDQLPCKFTTAHVRIRHSTAVVELTYRYACDTSSAEYYFPMSEVGNLKSLNVQWKQGAATAEMRTMTGTLYEQRSDGETRPWTKENEAADSDGESETQSLLGSMFSSKPKPKTVPLSERTNYYFFGTSPELMDLVPGKDVVVKVSYVVACATERQQMEERDLVVFVMPLTVFSHPPDRFEVVIEARDFIRRVRPQIHAHRIWTDITGRKATVRLHEGFALPLEDEYFTLNIELGEPIEPRCADPVALLIFATFIGLMLWFSLTKDLH